MVTNRTWSWSGTLLALAACAAGPSLQPPVAAAQGGYVRHVTGMEVIHSDGRPLDHPFLGGLNVPRPQQVDIDGDGDLDLFIQERSGELMFFERVGQAQRPEYRWRTDKYQDLNIGEWYRFADIDEDGDPDLLAEKIFSYISYYRNDGQPGAPRLVLVADTLRAVDGSPLFSDRQNIPNVTDLDCDGHLDLFIGRLVGTVTRYEAGRVDENNVPMFRFVTDRFEEIEIIANPAGGLHGANTLALTDIDNDGDQDLFWGDFFEQGLLFIENTGSCTSPQLRGEPVQFPVGDPVLTSGYNAMAFGDTDQDGNEDLLVGVLGGAYNPNLTTVDNLLWLRQAPAGQFEVVTRTFIRSIDVGSESFPALADLDGDGDLDLYLANKIDPGDLNSSVIYRYENVGTAREPRLVRNGTLDLLPMYHQTPAFADLDGDGDLDALVGGWRNRLALFTNEGSRTDPRFVLSDSAAVTITRGSNTVPALGDLDGDGDLDLIIGESSGALNYYQNTGSATAPVFTLVSDEWLDIDVGRRSAPALVDLDDDGDLDLVVGSEANGLVTYRNDGSRTEPDFREAPSLAPVFDYSTPAFGDVDGDGDFDLMVGTTGGGLLFFERR